jgi:Calcineurin-like phosphoesterase
MNEGLIKLYEKLGYKGPLPPTEVKPSDLTLESLAPGTLSEETVGRVTDARAKAGQIVTRSDPAEVPPLSPDGVDELEERLNSDTEETLARARALIDEDMTEAVLRSHIEQARMALRFPDTAVALMEAEDAHFKAANRLPEDFTFEGMDLDDIPIDPGSKKFELLGDLLGWIIHAGPFILTKPYKKNFRFHSYPQFSASKFIYKMDDPSLQSPLEIALLSDFGTGLYHARYIAKQLRTKRFPYAIHLGDVYYAGRRSEFEEHFAGPLDPILTETQFFALNSNHEMYSAGIPYFEFMDKRRTDHPDTQRQEGSYFCLRSTAFQIVGIDTAFFGPGRHEQEDLLEWLAKTLNDGKSTGCINILLSADHPYQYGSPSLTDLLEKDLKALVLKERLVDLWFWGNTHYCALFNKTLALPFIGSCIGHAGYPYDRKKVGKEAPAPVTFLETAARFPEWTALRQDRGNNGYCIMSLSADGSIRLRYLDWIGQLRCETVLTRSGDSPLNITSVELGVG